MKVLLEICDRFQLSSAEGKVAFADFVHGDHVETANVASEDFSQWLGYCYYKQTGRPPPLEMLNAVLRLLHAKARFEAPRRDIDLRTGTYINSNGDRVLLIDLGDETWRYVKVTRHGWDVRERRPTPADPSGMDGAPVRLCRSATMLPMPMPVRGGSLLNLAPFLGVEQAAALQSPVFVLSVGWLLVALPPVGVYLHLLLSGGPGSLKSSIGKRLNGLIDPHELTERTLPTTPQEPAIAAKHAASLFFDNTMDAIPRALVPAICMAATGGAHATRTLYSVDGETVLKFKRPLTIAGTAEMATATEVAERSIQLPLPKFQGKYKAPDVVEAVWEMARPSIFGALLDVVAGGLAQEATGATVAGAASSSTGGVERMIGALNWVTACEPALGWPAGTFLGAYQTNLELGAERVADADAVVTALRDFMAAQPEVSGEPGVRAWKGSATDLLSALNAQVGPLVARGRDWPKLPNALSLRLCSELVPTLDKLGIVVTRDIKQHAGRRSLTVTQSEKAKNHDSGESGESGATPDGGGPTEKAGSASGSASASASLKNPGERPVPTAKTAPGGTGGEAFLCTGEKRVSVPVSPEGGATQSGRAKTPGGKGLGSPPAPPGGVVAEQEIKMQSGTAKNKKPEGGGGGRRREDEGGAAAHGPLVQPWVEEPSEKPARRRIRITPEQAP